MNPLFTFLGGKHQLARRLGRPRYEHVIEPFAGSAGYSVYWAPQYAKRVTLIERDPIIANVWRYLIRVPAREILALPAHIRHVDELRGVCEEAKALAGFWFDHGLRLPARGRHRWARRPSERAFFWSETIKLRLASQVELIRHWEIIEGDYHDAPDVVAHWHIDPPYESENKNLYRCNAIDYADLADWCRSRKGFVQVCEHGDADWLPFRQYAMPVNRFRNGFTSEAVFEMAN